MPGPPSAVAPGSEAFRLPRSVEPETYRIEIEPNVASASFSGTVAIDIVVHEPVSQIVLNAAELAVSDVDVITPGGATVHCTVDFDDDLEQVIFRPGSEIAPGSYTLSCRFTGALNDKLRGFYRSTYTGLDGEVQTIATTQFESVDARRCFPCFDEPDRKAVFEVALIVEPDVEAISNSPVVGVDPVGEKRRIRFAPTMKMSTYLVAFVVGKLETTRTVDVDGVPLRVVCTPGKAAPGRVRARGRRVCAALLHRLLQHPLPRRQGRPRRHPRLRRRRHGEPRLHHVPGHCAAHRPGPARRARSSSASPTSSPTSWPTCGSATS